MQTSKLKTLLIYQLLERYSDEENPVTSVDIVNMLAEKGIKGERKSIYSDIETLREVGYDIVTRKGHGFFMGTRNFEIPEVMLLIDAVASAGFITPKKTNSLIQKLKSLLSENQAKTMVNQVYVDVSANKCDNEEIYITIDRLHDAIKSKRKVEFKYRRRNVDMENKKKYTEKVFVVSPYALIWKDDHYYLVCNNEKYDNLMNLRIDRIKKLKILDSFARSVSEVSNYQDEFDAQDYSSKMFNMFSGEECQVDLKCDLTLQEEMIDRFGSSIPLRASDVSHFETSVNATLSDGFISWIMQYGDKIEVLSPSSLKEAVKEKALQICRVYEK